jgi:hypothetical protein
MNAINTTPARNIELSNHMEFNPLVCAFFAEVMEALTGSADPTEEQTAAVFGRPMTWARSSANPRDQHVESFYLIAKHEGYEVGRLESVSITRNSYGLMIGVGRHQKTNQTIDGFHWPQQWTEIKRIPTSAKQWAKAIAKALAK